MTPEQKIKREILLIAHNAGDVNYLPLDTGGQVDERYEAAGEHGDLYDTESEFRVGQVETDIPCDYSRHYESKSVARKLSDGSWVGWTYWYGGGKHGEPEAIDWKQDAYELTCVEEEKLVTVRTFAKA